MIRAIDARFARTGRSFFWAILVLCVFAGPSYAQVDVKPIAGAELQAIKESYRKGDYARVVRDLTPLQGMKLTQLSLEQCREVQDLRPLQGMDLTFLHLRDCSQVQDLTPLHLQVGTRKH